MILASHCSLLKNNANFQTINRYFETLLQNRLKYFMNSGRKEIKKRTKLPFSFNQSLMRYLQFVLVFLEDCVLSVPVKSFLFDLSFYGLNAQLTSLKLQF